MTSGAITQASVGERLPSRTVIDASRGSLAGKVGEYRRFETLFLFLTLRDITLRYRQTVLGVLWAIVQPILPMAIFTIIFSRVLRPATGTIPYWLFALAGLAPWTFFANAINSAGQTFVNNHGLLNKVYFPRAVLPGAAVAASFVDWIVTGAFLTALLFWKGYWPRVQWLWLPLIALLAILLAFAVGLAIASLAAVYRDVKHVLPFLVQLWMYATPVIYPASLLPRKLQGFVGLNPMAGVVEAFRSCLFGATPDLRLLALSALSSALIAIAAVFLFHRLEADLAERA
jgi:lipopolysaccharide transport system permease protein